MAGFFTTLAEAGQNLNNVMLIVDNVSAHSDIERVTGEAMILRFAQHSASLNPIELAWSQTFADNFPRMILEEDQEIAESQTTYQGRSHKGWIGNRIGHFS